ncbi:MAG: amidohydrolase family protein [Phycisphaeraceae bacterium]|nr:amidohydrolase family protein [Phycisphaerales bacterium]MCB9844302.1 amidohydrolase family protein [Phycisphaeraceae bacterium]
MSIDACFWLNNPASDGDPMAEPSDAGGAIAPPGSMDCIEAAFVLTARSDHLGVSCDYERLAALVSTDPSRWIGVAGIDPGTPSAMDDLARCLEIGMRGVCVSPADQNCRPTSDAFLEVMEWCAARSMPVWVQNPRLGEARSVLEFASPALLDEAARTIPELRMVVGDLGVVHLDELCCLIAKHPRVFAEISAIVRHARRAPRVLVEAMERGVMHKLLFGSGYPHVSPEAAIERLYGAGSFTGGVGVAGGGVAVPREQVRAIVERDTLELLGIEMIPEPRTPVGIGGTK